MGLTITNHGTIGIRLTKPSDNPVIVATGASIVTPVTYGHDTPAIHGSKAASWSITNHGTVEGYSGIRLAGSGVVTNAAGAMISGAGYGTGVEIDGRGVVTNDGSVSGYFGVEINGGGMVTNGSASNHAASLYGAYDAVAIDGPATVTNFGTITGAVQGGVYLGSGSLLGNGSSSDTSALISGPIGARFVNRSVGGAGTDTVVNHGIIRGEGAGIYFSSSFGGVAGTVTNAGTISSLYGPSIQFGVGDERLIVDPGAVFVGAVLGGSGHNTLELASARQAGHLAGLGASFTNFNSVVVDNRAHWSLAGSNSAVSGTTIDVKNQATLTITGSLEARGSLNLEGVGVFNGAGTIAIHAASVLNVVSQSVKTGHLTFLAGGSETVELHHPAALTGSIAGFGASSGNVIDLVGEAATGITYTMVDATDGVLTVKHGAATLATLHFNGGNYHTSQFHSSVVGGSTHVTFA